MLSLFKDLLIMFQQVISDPLNTRGPKQARLQDKAKGNLAKKTGSLRPQVQTKRKLAEKTVSRKDEPPPLAENPDETWQDEPPCLEESLNDTRDDSNEKPLPCEFTVVYIKVSGFTMLIIYATRSRDGQ